MATKEELTLLLNGWGKDGNSPVLTISPDGELAIIPTKPGTAPLTFTAEEEAEFKAAKDNYLARVPRPVFREDPPLARAGDEDVPELFAEEAAYADRNDE